MVQFVCDSCGVVKEPSEGWIVGMAAEAVGATSARREATILSGWERANAVHPLAVHFCSLECKDGYVSRLFGPETGVETRAGGRTVGIRGAVGKRVGPARNKVQSRKHGGKKSA